MRNTLFTSLFFLLCLSVTNAQAPSKLTDLQFRNEFLNATWIASDTTGANDYEQFIIMATTDSLYMAYVDFIEFMGSNSCSYAYQLTGKWFEIQSKNCTAPTETVYIYGYFIGKDQVSLCFPSKRTAMDKQALKSGTWIRFTRFKE